jgi:hypothetical protein
MNNKHKHLYIRKGYNNHGNNKTTIQQIDRFNHENYNIDAGYI